MTPSDKKLEKLNDLGLAAFLKMKGVPVEDVNPKQVIFDISDPSLRERVKRLKVDYVNSEYATFDGWLATLKTMPVSEVDVINPSFQTVKSLGLSAFIKMKYDWRLLARVQKNHFIYVVPIEQTHDFEQAHIDWANSDLRNFDSEMMTIKSGRLKHR